MVIRFSTTSGSSLATHKRTNLTNQDQLRLPAPRLNWNDCNLIIIEEYAPPLQPRAAKSIGQKRGGIPLVPPTCRAEKRIIMFLGGPFSLNSTSEERLELTGTLLMLLVLLVDLYHRTSTADHV
jgi:hypothetical protein